jgi:hypothetical protein
MAQQSSSMMDVLDRAKDNDGKMREPQTSRVFPSHIFFTANLSPCVASHSGLSLFREFSWHVSLMQKASVFGC